MREERTLLVGLLSVCVVSTAALARLIAVVRIFRRQRRRRSCLSSGSFTNGDPSHHQQQHHLHQDDDDAMPAPTDGDRVASSRVLVPSLLFHVLVFLCLVVEVPVYACRWLSASGIEHFAQQGRQLYSLHMTGFLMLFMAFSVVVTLWSDVAVFEPNEWTALVNRWGRVMWALTTTLEDSHILLCYIDFCIFSLVYIRSCCWCCCSRLSVSAAADTTGGALLSTAVLP